MKDAENQLEAFASDKDAEGVNPPPAAESASETEPPAPRPAISRKPRWNLRRIMCFSHDGRRRDVELVPGEMNIITGNSHTGKSALAELIDYVMGSAECNLPRRVRNSTSWVGLLWSRPILSVLSVDGCQSADPPVRIASFIRWVPRSSCRKAANILCRGSGAMRCSSGSRRYWVSAT